MTKVSVPVRPRSTPSRSSFIRLRDVWLNRMLSPGSVKHLNHGEHREHGACFSLCSPCSLWFILSRSWPIVSTLAILACGRTTIPTQQIEASDSAGIRITTILSAPESLPVWSLEPEPRRVFTGTETGDETAFAFIGPVKFLTNGSLVIADVASARLMIYDAQGAFVRFHARRGDGPGEIRRLESIDRKSVV